MKDNNNLLARVYKLDQQGRLREAVDGYRQVIATEPRNSDALHLLGVALARLGKTEDAVRAIAAAVELQPRNPAMLTNFGNVLRELGRNSEALEGYDRALQINQSAAAHRGRGSILLRLGQPEAALAAFKQAVPLTPQDANAHCDLGVALERVNRNHEALQTFEKAIALNPNHADAHHNRGLVQGALGRHPEALASLDQALKLRPDQPAILINRGNALRALDRPSEAVASYDAALARLPENAAAHHNRGMALMSLGRHLEAASSFERSLALQPNQFNAHFYRGVAFLLLERYEDCLIAFECALALRQNSAEALNNRGIALARLSRSVEALDHFQRAIRASPNNAEAYTNVANVQKGLKLYTDALHNFDRALTLVPDDAMANWSKALLQLTLGRFAEGWPLYETRLRLPQFQTLQRKVDLPRWSGGEPTEGRTLLVHAEQGLGDTVQCCRYIPLLEARGVRVVFEVQPALKELMKSLRFGGTLAAYGEPLPVCDFYIPLLSLPLAFRTEMDSIPASVPYLLADPQRKSSWQQRLDLLPGIKVGLNWQGNPETEKQPWIRGRSFALSAAEPLSRLSHVSLVSLQKGAGYEQLTTVSFKEKIISLTDALDLRPEAMLDAAALISCLDLVITSDTLVAHLAGALGVPVWVALPASPDWRWLEDREDSPWYPTMRLFRQPDAGNWTAVLEKIADALAVGRFA